MSLKCLFKHCWYGCICSRCGTTRDQGHEWDGCVCRRCGKIRDEDHDWHGCKCRRCGKVSHHLDGCKCTVCGKEVHDFRNESGQSPQTTAATGEYVCSRCHAVYHREYVGTECSYCGGKGYYEAYSSDSGCGGSWEEECPFCKDILKETKEWITHPETKK